MAIINVSTSLSTTDDISEVLLDLKASESVPNGGVLFALPALLSIGLLHNTKKYFQLPKGYYRPQHHDDNEVM